MDFKVATIISYCSNDSIFLKPCIEEAKKFSNQIIVVAADHLFDNTLEDLLQMKKIFSFHKDVDFFIYPFIPHKIPKRILKKVKEKALWHSVSRMVGANALSKNIDWVLFLDVDEIVDGKKIQAWIAQGLDQSCNAFRLANYWYFRKTTLVAKEWEDTPVLVKRKKISSKSLLDSAERDAIYEQTKGEKRKGVLGLDNLPMIHHYSWVRSKEEIIKKVTTWVHKDDKDWKKLIEEEFEKESNRDFVHGYELLAVSSFVQLEAAPQMEICSDKPINILSEKELLNIIKKRSVKDFFWCKLEEMKDYFST